MKVRSGSKTNERIIQAGFHHEGIFQWPITLSLFLKLHRAQIEDNLEFIQYGVNNRRHGHKISLRELEITLICPYLEIEEAKHREGGGRRKRKKTKGEKKNCTSQKKSVFRILTHNLGVLRVCSLNLHLSLKLRWFEMKNLFKRSTRLRVPLGIWQKKT